MPLPSGDEPFFVTDTSVTCWAEEEGRGLLQMLIELIGDGHLCVSKGAKRLLISGAHFWLNVVEKQCKGAAAEVAHLPRQKTHTPLSD